MLTLTSNPLSGTFLVRPVCKVTDRLIIRELFRKEFYGDDMGQSYPDEGLWEIYDNMEPASDLNDGNHVPAGNDMPFGAYMVYWHDRLLFLLEVHPPLMMGLPPELSRPGTVGIFCFYNSLLESMNGAALRCCIGCLLDFPSVHRVLTTLTYSVSGDPKIGLLERSGFKRLSKSPDHAAVYCCTAKSFPLLSDTGSLSHSLSD